MQTRNLGLAVGLLGSGVAAGARGPPLAGRPGSDLAVAGAVSGSVGGAAAFLGLLTANQTNSATITTMITTQTHQGIACARLASTSGPEHAVDTRPTTSSVIRILYLRIMAFPLP